MCMCVVSCYVVPCVLYVCVYDLFYQVSVRFALSGFVFLCFLYVCIAHVSNRCPGSVYSLCRVIFSGLCALLSVCVYVYLVKSFVS